MTERNPDGWDALDPAPLLALWEAYFGVAPATFAGLAFFRRRAHRDRETTPLSGSIWVRPAGIPVPPAPTPETLGLRVRRGDKPDTQLSNAFARRYFAGATRHVVHLEGPEEISSYFTTGDLSARQPTEGDGYYLVLGPWGVLGRARAHAGALWGEPSKNERMPPIF